MRARFGNLRGVFNAQTDKGEDADFSCETIILLGLYTYLRLQQVVEVVDKVGEEVQEDTVEVKEEFFQLFLLELRRFGEEEEFFEFLVLHFLIHHLAVVVKLVDILRAETHESSDILFLDAVALGELGVHGAGTEGNQEYIVGGH